MNKRIRQIILKESCAVFQLNDVFEAAYDEELGKGIISRIESLLNTYGVSGVSEDKGTLYNYICNVIDQDKALMFIIEFSDKIKTIAYE